MPAAQAAGIIFCVFIDHYLPVADNQPSSFITASMDCRHGGSATPKAFLSLSLQSCELCGLAAGVGYSLLGMGIILARLPWDKPRLCISSTIAVANLYHETFP